MRRERANIEIERSAAAAERDREKRLCHTNRSRIAVVDLKINRRGKETINRLKRTQRVRGPCALTRARPNQNVAPVRSALRVGRATGSAAGSE